MLEAIQRQRSLPVHDVVDRQMVIEGGYQRKGTFGSNDVITFGQQIQIFSFVAAEEIDLVHRQLLLIAIYFQITVVCANKDRDLFIGKKRNELTDISDIDLVVEVINST